MNLRHHGNWPEIARVRSAPGFSIGLYECPLCWALTREPNDHADWHIARGDFSERDRKAAR